MQPELRGRIAHHAGDAAEQQVARYYQRQGYEILARRWRGAGGEIDLILRHAATMVFVEVKKGPSIARAAERISPRQVRRIMVAAEEFLADHPSGTLSEMRFDAALVDAQGAFEILENAFDGG
ncbi:YraN family protein [Microbulbifer sp. S227A]|uniref:YraN family protein n=1 Tax=Microbulbifer sp. S227A TaxID=3415131 RepID=UPI003C7AAD96